MHRRTLIAAGAAALVAPTVRAAPAIGDVVPALSLPDQTGQRFDWRALRGRVAVLQWAHLGCPFFGKHYTSGSMAALQKETAGRVTWLMVESNQPAARNYLDPSELVAWLQQHGSPVRTVLMDDSGDAARAFGARTASHSFVVGADGRLLYGGAVDSIASPRAEDIPRAVPHLRRALEDVLAGRAPAVPLTRPYGCALQLA
jgi:hypothetical protein